VCVIAEDLVCRARVEIRQGRATPADLEHFGGEAASGLSPPHSLQAFLGCPAHRGRNRFSCYGSQFPHEFLGRQVLDVQRHDLMLPWQNLSVRTDKFKADIFNRVFGVIRGALVANIVAIVGAMFAVAKPAGH
jgi:hypothetical protein